MTHPFDDFLPKSWHVARTDQRVVKFGIMFVVLISVATVGAFVVSMGNWRSVAEDSMEVARQWNDAQHRVHEYVKVQKELKDAEKESGEDNIGDQKRYLIDQKIEVLRNLSLN